MKQGEDGGVLICCLDGGASTHKRAQSYKIEGHPATDIITAG